MPCKPAISSHSLGRAWAHDLASKLDQAAQHNFALELFHEDLIYTASALPGGATPSNQLLAARHIRALCDARHLTIMCLQPFMHYEALLDRSAHAARLADMRHLWIPMAKILDTHFIAVPSSFLPADQVSGDVELMVRDLRDLADLGAEFGVAFAYEALCWGTHVNTWEQSWNIVQQVSKPNFKICFDTFNLAGKVWADPERLGGVLVAADDVADDDDDDDDDANCTANCLLQQSLHRLLTQVDVRKIAYIQVVDAEKLSSPLVPGHEFYTADQPARMSWSRNCRLFYGEESRGAYLPINAILKTLLVDLGFEGYISAEVFHRDLAAERKDVPKEFAERARVSWEKIVRDFQLVTEEEVVVVRGEEDISSSAGGVVDRFSAVEGAAARAQL